MHALVNDADAAVPAPSEQGSAWRLVLLSAADQDGLAAGAAGVVPDAADAAITLHTAGASSGACRAALLSDGAAVEEVASPGAAPAAERELTLMFPGLGDHYLDMGRDLYRDFPVFRAEVDRCAELLVAELGLDLRPLVFSPREAAEKAAPEMDLRAMLGRGERTRSPQEIELDRPGLAQPALFTIEYALAKLWLSWGARPSALIGYSLGEYVAACLSGVLSLQDSLTLVARRAKLIEQLPEGGMLAVMLPEADVLPMLGEDLSLSAVNGPEFCVVAGPRERITDLEASLTARSIGTRRVRTTHAFHSSMMAPIADEVTALAATFERNAPTTPYVSNVTGALITDADATDAGYWARHLCQPVRFADGLDALGTEATLLEAGPGQTLSSLAVPNRAAGTVVASMRHSLQSQSDTAVLLKAVGRLWLNNTALDWSAFPAVELQTGGPAATAPAGAATEATPTEAKLSTVWERLLKFPVASTTVSFFDIGGNSLIATRLMLRVMREFGVEMTLRQVYENPTVAAMAAVLDGTATEPTDVAGTSLTDRPQFTLPNGLKIRHQNEAETLHFYEDIFDHRTYAKHGISIPDGATVVDVGGNIGLFTLFSHYEAKDVTVYTFEPAPQMFELLSGNVAEHGVNAKLFNIGISDGENTAEFTFYPRSTGMSSFHADADEEKHNLRTIIANQQAAGGQTDAVLAEHTDELLDVRVEAIPFTATLRPLSAVIAEQGIERIDLIKIDVQKSELGVIAGIAENDWPKIQQMVLEAHDGDGAVAYLVELLRGKGFEVLAEQDPLYVGTDIHNIYATRSN